MGVIIPLKAVSLSKQIITQDFGVNLELAEEYVKYSLHFLAEEPINNEDIDQGWQKDVVTNFQVVALKKHISGVEKTLCGDGKRWMVCIIVQGFKQDIQIYFRKHAQAEAEELFLKILQYLTNGNNDKSADQ